LDIWYWWQNRGALAVALVIALAISTIAMMVIHAQLRRTRDALARMIRINERAEARRTLTWDDAPMPPDAGAGQEHPYAWDLNVVGRASLAQRIGTPVTRYGWDAVYHALLAPGSAKEVPPRQDAVWELAVEIDVHQRV